MADQLNQKLGLDAQGAINAVTALQASIIKLNRSMGTATTKMEAFAAAGTKLESAMKTVNTGATTASTSMGTFGTNAKKAGSQATEGMNQVTKSINSIEKSAKTMSQVLQVQLFIRFFNQITQGFQDATVEALAFSKAIGEISTISGTALGGFDAIAAKVREVADELGRPVAEVAEAEYQTLSNQVVAAADSFEFLGQAHQLALATNSSLMDSVAALSSSLNSYRDSTLTATSASDVLMASVELGRLRLEEVANTLGKIYPLTSEMGISMQEASAAFVTMTQSGLKANTAIVYLRALMTSMLKPTETLKGILEDLGVSTFPELVSSSGGLAGALESITTAAESSNIGLEKILPNTRSLNAALLVTGDNAERFGSVLDDIYDSAGAAADAAAKMEETDYRKVMSSVNSLKNAFVTMGEVVVAALAKISPVIDALSSNVPALAAAVTTGSVGMAASLVMLAATAEATAGAFAALWAAAWPVAVAALIGAGLGYLISKLTEVDTTAKDAAAGMEQSFTKMDEVAMYTAERVQRAFSESMQEARRVVAESAGYMSDDMSNLSDTISQAWESISTVFANSMAEGVETLNDAVSQAKDAIDGLTDAQKYLKNAADSNKAAQLALKLAVEQAATANQKAHILEKDAIEKSDAALKAYYDLIKGKTPVTKENIKAVQKAFDESADSYKKAAAQYKKGSAESVKYGKQQLKVVQAAEKAIDNLNKKYGSLQGSEKTQAEAAVNNMEVIQAKIEELTKELAGLEDTKDIDVQFERDRISKEIQALTKELNAQLKSISLFESLGITKLGEAAADSIANAISTMKVNTANVEKQLEALSPQIIKVQLDLSEVETSIAATFGQKYNLQIETTGDIQQAANDFLTSTGKILPELVKINAQYEALTEKFYESNSKILDLLVNSIEDSSHVLQNELGVIDLAGIVFSEEARNKFKTESQNYGASFVNNFKIKAAGLLEGIAEAQKSNNDAEAAKLGQEFADLFKQASQRKLNESGKLKWDQMLEDFGPSIEKFLPKIDELGKALTDATNPAEAGTKIRDLRTLTEKLVDIFKNIHTVNNKLPGVIQKQTTAEQLLLNKAKSVKTVNGEIVKSVDDITKGIDEAAGSADDLNNKSKDILDELPGDAEKAKNSMEGIKTPIDGLKTSTDAAKTSIDGMSTSATAVGTGFSTASTQAASLNTLATPLNTTLATTATSSEKIGGGFSLAYTNIGLISTILPSLVTSALAASTSLLSVGEGLQEAFDPEPLTEGATAATELSTALETVSTVDMSAVASDAEKVGDGMEEASDNSEAFNNNLQETYDALAQVNEAVNSVATAISKLSSGINNATTQWTAFQSAAYSSVTAVNKIATAVDAVCAAIKTAISLMNALTSAAIAAAAAVASAVSAASSAGIANSGKYITRASGGSIGTDTQAAMLSPGEFVVKDKAAKQFYSELVAMNAGATPNGSGGGTHISNTADVKINVNGAQDASQTGREIVRLINTELNRGTVKLKQ